MISEEDRKFGESLLKSGVVTPEQFDEVLKYKKHHNEDVTKILVDKGFATEKETLQSLAEYLNLPFIELQDYTIDDQVLEIVPKDLIFKHKIFPVFKIENSLTVAMSNPKDVRVIDTLYRETGLDIEPAVCLCEEIENAIESHWGRTENLDSSYDEVIKDLIEIQPANKPSASVEKLKEQSEEAPVVKLVNIIIKQAILDHASDIHIEPEEDSLQVRVRIDGILHESLSPPKHLQAAIISRIKILADLDIAESRVPQDGRCRISFSGHEVDIRVSTLPTVHGENVVLRILDRSNLTLDLKSLGMERDSLQLLTNMLSSSYGVMLVSGPTGSGKTTTLYSALQTINTPDKNIVTIEDPVEYRIRRIRQTHVNVKAGLTFAQGLRSILRQDPDVIMVGEIRDTETAKIAVESALTGHLVLSTIHTNDAPGGLTRLTEMGVEPFLTASATIGIIAQRLVRKLCENCRQTYEPKPEIVSQLSLPPNLVHKERVFYRSAGCKVCKNTGYRGRAGIYEIMLMNEEIRELTLKNAASEQIKRAAFENGMRSLRGDAIIKAVQGVTSLEEVFRVTNADQDTI
ncbi:MAG: GspE/PulE family protein [bacterium]